MTDEALLSIRDELNKALFRLNEADVGVGNLQASIANYLNEQVPKREQDPHNKLEMNSSAGEQTQYIKAIILDTIALLETIKQQVSK